MPRVKKPARQLRRHFFKQWRQFRHLTQEQAADRMNIDRSVLGKIENVRIPYSQGLLEAASEAYMCEPWDILNRDPFADGDVVDFTEILRSASPEERAEIIGYARGRVSSKAS